MRQVTKEEQANRQQFRKDYPMCEAAIKTAHKNINDAFKKTSYGDVKQLKTEFLIHKGLNTQDYDVVITCENSFDKSSPNKYICRNHAHYKAVPKNATHIQKLQSEKEELLAKIAALESDLAYAQSRNKKLEKRDAQLQNAFAKIYREAEKIVETFCENEVGAESFAIN